MARRFTCAVAADLRADNRVIAAAKAARPLPFVFPPVGPEGRLRLFVDASSVNTGVPVAHTEYAVFASPASVPAGRLPPDSPLTLLAYGSHRQRRETHSSFAAEVYAMLEGVRAATDVAVVHALLASGDEYQLAPLDVYTENLSLYNTLDADGVVAPKEVGAAVQELRELYHGGALATSVRAPGQLADVLTKHNRRSALEDTLRLLWHPPRPLRFPVQVGAGLSLPVCLAGLAGPLLPSHHVMGMGPLQCAGGVGLVFVGVCVRVIRVAPVPACDTYHSHTGRCRLGGLRNKCHV